MEFIEIEILSVPKIFFACSVDVENLHNYFEYKPDFIEISAMEDGRIASYSLDGKLMRISDPHRISGIYKDMAAETFSYNGERQRHTTVGVKVKYNMTRYKSEEECNLDELKARMTNSNIALVPYNYDPGDDFDNVLNAIKKIIAFNSSSLYSDKMNAVSAWFSLLGLLTDMVLTKLNISQNDISPSEFNYSLTATKYITQHFNKKLTVSEIAEHVGISEGYLHRIFKNTKNCGILEYINHVRVNHFISLIENKHLSLRNASLSVGIDDPAYMSRLFKKTTGISFREYFREKRKN